MRYISKKSFLYFCFLATGFATFGRAHRWIGLLIQNQTAMEWTPVERAFLAKSGRDESYAGEHAKIVEVMNVYELGQIVAVAFLEWVKAES